MNQTRIGSLIESGINILIGFWINFFANLLILPLFGFTQLTLGTNFMIGIAYTLVSVARSYAVRRWFNARLHAASLRMAAQMGGST